MEKFELKGSQLKAASDALASAFPSWDDLDQLLLYELDRNLADYTSEVKTLPIQLLELLRAANSQAFLEPLLLAAFKVNPGNPKLRELGPVMLLDSKGTASPNLQRALLPPVQLQGEVLRNNALVDIEAWRKGIERVQKSVARFQIENMKANNAVMGVATGFLVADDVLLTNCHVVDDLFQKGATAPAVKFDVVTGEDGGESGSEVYPLEGGREAWLLGSSPVNELDYALVRLPKGTGRPVMPTPKPYDFSNGDIYFIVQHPEGDPMKVGGGTMIGFNTAQQRVNYTTNTMPGSSGSPVFTTGWQPVALHCAGSMDERYNMGVPLSVVYDDAVKRGFWPAAKP